MNCQIGRRSPEKIWLIKMFLKSYGETLRLRIKTLPVLLLNYQWGREQKWNRARVSTAFTLTSRTRASCRRCAGTGVAKAEYFGDLTTADPKILSEESESRNNHRYAVVVQFGNSLVTISPIKQKLLTRPRRAQ